MTKDILKKLDPIVYNGDYIEEKLLKEPVINQQLNFFANYIIISVVIMIICIFCIIKQISPGINPVFYVKADKNYKVIEGNQIETVSTPHQSLENLRGWVWEAVYHFYALDFSKVNEQIDNAEYYFTPEGYQMYLTAVKPLKEEIEKKHLQMNIVPLINPTLINTININDMALYRVRAQMLVTYYGGKEEENVKKNVELLITQVPAHKNIKCLAISEIIIS
jgi:hypothetical protein